MATQAPPTTIQCPTCGARLARAGLSLCAYCASPLQIGGKVATPDDEVTKRLARLRQHAEFQARLAWIPTDHELEESATRLMTISWPVIAAGLAAAVGGALRGSQPSPLLFAGAGIAALGAILLLVGKSRRESVRKQPMMKRPAMVTDRRSETDSERGGTNYFFYLRFDDGGEGEFRFRGRGTQYDPMANGATGIAYTRGDRLIEFHRIAS